MIPIIGGLGAAIAWTVSTLCTSRSSRLIPPASVLGWVMLIGAIESLPFALAGGVPAELDRTSLAWVLLAGAANIVGLLTIYTALRIGKVGIVAPINSAQGAATAVIAILAGESVAPGTGLMLALIAVGVVLASMATARKEPGANHDARAAALAAVAACLFGFGLYATGRMSENLPITWVLFPQRLLGVVVITVPLALAGRLRLTRKAAPLVLASGVCEVLGLVAYGLGARSGIAVTAIIASQFAALSAVAAYFLFDERLARVQVAGVVAILVGVTVLTALQA